MLKSKQLSLISPKLHPSPIPAPEVLVEASSGPYTGCTKQGEKVAQTTQLQESLLAACLLQEHKRASKDMGMAELLRDSKGKARREGDLQHVCITVTARREQPEWATWQLLWTERQRDQAGNNEINTVDR